MIKIASIFLFGFLGGILRYIIDQNIHTNQFPIGILVINILGSFILGFITAGFLAKQPNLNAGLTIGLLGGFTTFSSFQLKIYNLINSNNILIGVFYMMFSIFVGIFFAGVGQKLGKFMFSKINQIKE